MAQNLAGLSESGSIPSTPLAAPSVQGSSTNPRAKHWCFTWNNYPDNYEKIFSQLNDQQFFAWAFYGVEVAPTTGTPHLQGMISFKGQVYRNTVYKAFKKMAPMSETLPQLIIKSDKSTFQEGKDYCSKGQQPTDDWKKCGKDSMLFGLGASVGEYGTMPLDQKTAGLKKIKDNYEATLKYAKTGEFDKIAPEHMIKHRANIKAIAKENKPMPADLNWAEGQQPNLWIYGPTGTGKSHRARDLLKEFGPFYSKNIANKWWDKYEDEESVLCEDIDLSHSYQGFYLKIWADKYAYPCEIKNSGDLIRPKRIFVTSNYTIQQVFPDPSIHLPLLRRFKVLHMDIPWDSTVNDILVDKQVVPKKPSLKRTRARRFDQPLPAVPLLMRDKRGVLVPAIQKQKVVDDFLEDVRPTKIAKKTIPVPKTPSQKAFIEIPDTSSEDESSSSSDLISDSSEESSDMIPEELLSDDQISEDMFEDEVQLPYDMIQEFEQCGNDMDEF